jgi:DNA-directed RNA polymerase sigma subunit (sigma70/sigma32)
MLDLPEEERRVITLRFGLEDGRVMNVQEVAELSRCSKDWVKRIEGRALRKLRLPKHQQRSVLLYNTIYAVCILTRVHCCYSFHVVKV